ncbi:unnamed protein product [Amoebophrya sp. A120]|nr:unnamed protein product [Amoebophrya sp. A120]|eukprot:GSA120T00025143001.1
MRSTTQPQAQLGIEPAKMLPSSVSVWTKRKRTREHSSPALFSYTAVRQLLLLGVHSSTVMLLTGAAGARHELFSSWAGTSEGESSVPTDANSRAVFPTGNSSSACYVGFTSLFSRGSDSSSRGANREEHLPLGVEQEYCIRGEDLNASQRYHYAGEKLEQRGRFVLSF